MAAFDDRQAEEIPNTSALEAFLMTITRRQFGQLAIAASTGTLISHSATTVSAAEPIARNGSPHMKLSLAAYSFHRYLSQNWPRGRGGGESEMSLLDFIDFCAEQDLDGCELTSYYFPAKQTDFGKLPEDEQLADLESPKPKQEVPHDFLMEVKQRTFRLGLDISGTAIGNDFCVAFPQEMEEQLLMTRQWIDYAAAMGAPVIRIFAGNVPQGDTEAAALERCVSGINLSLAYAAQKGVALALENHGGITATPEQLLAIVERVEDSPWFGVNFDSGNFHTADPYAAMEMIAPYAINAQIKVSIHPQGGERQKADFGRIIEILKGANYRGYVVLEFEEKTDPRESIPPILDELRGLITA